ncbi:uncharacterized protein Tco025E_00694 [Trypanosoma conorhini]|uniref:Uncharacterized protein n=1 Tax=Trypanosoma conorhini TaxID=83891 RepID=A0A3R7PL91_9TRYP|nr:uncharacterized protein Tco025E_00694 [Trypanosoma conorhini]RNF27057.1 hypothetical protein Tco025E_00694 [Trypanosoma conorhini]
MMTPDTANVGCVASSPVSSYPTYTPPPPLPARNSVRNTPSTAMQRTFHTECDEVLRLIREDGLTRSASEKSSGAMCVPRSSTHEKYRAILDEVEHLNKLLEVTVEERDDVEGELQGKLTQMEMALRESDRELQEKDEELMHLRGVVESLRTQLEKLTTEVVRRGSCSYGNGSDTVAAREAGGGPSTVVADVAPGERPATALDRLAQSSLRWVEFLLKRCFSVDDRADGKLTHLLGLLNELGECGSEPGLDAPTVRSLCTQVSNCLIEVAEKGALGRRHLDSDALDLPTATEGRVSGEQENLLRRQVAGLEAERDALRQEASIIAEENVQLLRELKSRELPSPGASSPSARVDGLKVQNATLVAERKRQAALIQELRLQVEKLEEEKKELQTKFVHQAESLRRHERVLHFISRHERGDKGDNGGSNILHTTLAQ